VDARKSYKLGARPAYYHDRSTYGGTIPWVGSHAIDWVMHLVGARFRSVYAAHSAAFNGGNGTMERSAVCQFTLEEDVFASASVDVFRPAAAPTHGDDWARVVGTAGTMEVRPESLALTTETAGPTQVPVSAGPTLVRDFIDHIEGRSRAWLDARVTLGLADACLRARQSADERRVVAFD
jgi:predicted dehydrogenase